VVFALIPSGRLRLMPSRSRCEGAAVDTIVDYKDAGDGVNGTAAGDERERISMTYQKIELTDLDSNKTAQDDWLGD